jgi:hypothetical protein
MYRSTFFFSALVGASCPGNFTPGKEPRFALERGLGWPHNRF